MVTQSVMSEKVGSSPPSNHSFSGVAEVREWYDDRDQRFRIEMSATNRAWGPLFGYSGRFQVERRSLTPDAVPSEILPRRVEQRE